MRRDARATRIAAIAALLMLLLAAPIPALEGETVGSSPWPPLELREVHMGETFSYARQTWTTWPNGSVNASFTPHLAFRFRDVQSIHDAAGTPRLTLLIELAWLREEVDPPPSNGSLARILLIDVETLMPFGILDRFPGYERFRLGTPSSPPDSAFLLPCTLLHALQVALAAPTPGPGLFHRSCVGPIAIEHPDLPVRTTEAGAGFPARTVREMRDPASRRPEGEFSLWHSPGTPVSLQIAQSIRIGEDAHRSGVEYLVEADQGGEISISEALEDARARQIDGVGATLAEYGPEGPQEGAPRLALPLAEARRVLREDPRAAPLHAYLETHPDAVVTKLGYSETPYAEGETRRWSFVWSDPEGDGFGINVVQEVLAGAQGGTPVELPPAPSEDNRSRYEPFVMRLSPHDMPSTAITLESAFAVAATRFPDALGRAQPNVLYWNTVVSADGERDTTNAPGSAVNVTFRRWQVTVGLSYSDAPGEPPNTLGGTRSAATQEALVFLDGETGRLLNANSRGIGAPPLHLLPLAEPRYSGESEALGLARMPMEPRYHVEPAFLVIGAGAAVGGALTLAAVLSLAVREALTRAVVMPLYNRLTLSRVIQHPRRRIVLDAVESAPGIGLSDLTKATELSEGTLRHHLRVLVRAGLLAEIRLHGACGYRPMAAATATSGWAGLLLRNPRARAVYAAVRAKPEGATVRRIANEVGIGTGAAYHHLTRLAGAGLLRLERTPERLTFRVVTMESEPAGAPAATTTHEPTTPAEGPREIHGGTE